MWTYRYFTVVPLPRKPGRKTLDYAVVNHQGETLGTIEFFPRWRQHVLAPRPNTVWSTGCLRDVRNALEKIRKEPSCGPSP